MRRFGLYIIAFFAGMVVSWFYYGKLQPLASNFKTKFPESNWLDRELEMGKNEFLHSLVYTKYKNLYMSYEYVPFRGESSIYSIAIMGRFGWSSEPHEHLRKALTYSDEFVNNDSVTTNLYKRYEQ